MFARKRRALSAILVGAMLTASLSVGLGVNALDNPPSNVNPMGMKEYVRELFGDKVHGWTDGGTNDPTQETLLGSFAWRAQYYDANPEWDGFYTFKYMRAESWSDKIDSAVYGQDWLDTTGQVSLQDVPYLVCDPGDGISQICLTYIAPEDGTYKIFPNAAQKQVRVMYPQYFPGGDKYDADYFPAGSTYKLGFAIHKMSEGTDMDTWDSAGSTKIWPPDASFRYLTTDATSFDFPTISSVELKEGDRLRFILDCTGTQGIEDWLIAASFFPMVKSAVNTPPTAQDDTYECTIGRSVSGTLKGGDADEGAVLTYARKTDGAKGTAVVNADGTFTYTADIGVEGTDTFVYTVTDEEGASADGTVTITFVDNKKPTAGKTAFETMEGTALTGDIEAADEDGDDVAVTLKTGVTHGTLALEEDGTFTYTPADGFTGEDAFTATLSDSKTPTDVTITIAVEKNEPPVAKDLTVKAKKNTATAITLAATDPNGTAVTYALVKQPSSGTVALADGKVTYTPRTDFTGFDSFTYTAGDGVNVSAEATVKIAVLGEGIEATKTLMDAIIECADDIEKNKVFDFSGYAYDLPWQFQYRIDGITGGQNGDLDAADGLHFETSIAASLFDWGGYQISDAANSYPTITFQNAGFLGNKMIGVLNSGYQPDSKNPVAALTFVAPKAATYYITSGEVTDQFGIWDGQAKETPIKVWAEVDGTIVWPVNGQPLALNSSQPKSALPDLHIAMKAGANLRFCVQGTTVNGDHNNVYLDPVAYEMGAYDKALDPVPDTPVTPPTEPDVTQPAATTTAADGTSGATTSTTGGDRDGDGDTPATGSALPVAAAALLAVAGATLVLCRRKRSA